MRALRRKLLCIAAVLIVIGCIMADGYMKRDLQVSGTPEAAGHYISVQTDQGIREISFEDYVTGVAACQIDAGSHPEVLKAQMILVRTNLYKELEENPDKLPSWSYRTLEELEEAGAAAVFGSAAEATYGQVLRLGEALVRLPYHKVSAGRTRDGEEALPGQGYDWLTGIECQSDLESPEYLGIEIWEDKELREAIVKAWPKSLDASGEVIGQLEIKKRDSADYVLEIDVGKKTVSGEKFRELLGLSSSCFYLETVDEGVRITTKGLGHGLGLSQFQAELMAEAGAGCQDILAAFFANLKIGTYSF